MNALRCASHRISLGSWTYAVRLHSTRLLKDESVIKYCSSYHFQYLAGDPTEVGRQIKFIPKTLNVDFGISINDNMKKNIIETPLRKIPCLEEPTSKRPAYEDLPIITNKPHECPTTENSTEKLAVRLIVIRRKKMKKHKRKKLRRKMYHIWAKLRLRRALKREKEFQAELLAQIHEAEKFDPHAYVKEKFDQLDKQYLPLTWRGEVLPKEMIKQFIKEKQEKEKARLNKPHITL